MLYSVAESSAVVTASGTLGAGTGIVASPIVNSTLGHVYVFLGQDNKTTTCLGGSSAHPCNGIYEFSTAAFTSGGMGSEVVLGPGVDGTYPLYAGDFDNAFYTSGNGTGSMYVCGQDNASSSDAAMYLVTISAGVATSAIGGTAGVLTNHTSKCSPVTEFYNPNLNGGTDQIFWSVVAHGLGAYCATAGCVNNANITPWRANHAYAVGNFAIDTNYVMEVVMTAGTSGASTPSWPTPGGTGAPSAKTTDGTVTWISQGFPTARHGNGWTANHAYTAGTTLWISSNNSYQYATVNGTSGGSTPAFSATPGVTEVDGTETWISLGVPSANSFEASGGASGIIIDNAVTSLAGASQLYFSNLTPGNPSSLACAASNGCAVQVSQSALK